MTASASSPARSTSPACRAVLVLLSGPAQPNLGQPARLTIFGGSGFATRTTEYRIDRGGLVSTVALDLGEHQIEFGGWYEHQSSSAYRRWYPFAVNDPIDALPAPARRADAADHAISQRGPRRRDTRRISRTAGRSLPTLTIQARLQEHVPERDAARCRCSRSRARSPARSRCRSARSTRTSASCRRSARCGMRPTTSRSSSTSRRTSASSRPAPPPACRRSRSAARRRSTCSSSDVEARDELDLRGGPAHRTMR